MRKKSKKYLIGGYAPGNYDVFCVTCLCQFKGDEDAIQCEPCAIKMMSETKNK